MTQNADPQIYKVLPIPVSTVVSTPNGTIPLTAADVPNVQTLGNFQHAPIKVVLNNGTRISNPA
jgi:hypothetical protein